MHDNMLGVQLMNVWTETSARHASLASALSEEYASLEKRIEDDLAREAHAERLKQRREKSAQRRQFALRRGSPRLGGDILGKDLMLNRELSEDEESASESDGAQLLTTVNSEEEDREYAILFEECKQLSQEDTSCSYRDEYLRQILSTPTKSTQDSDAHAATTSAVASSPALTASEASGCSEGGGEAPETTTQYQTSTASLSPAPASLANADDTAAAAAASVDRSRFLRRASEDQLSSNGVRMSSSATLGNGTAMSAAPVDGLKENVSESRENDGNGNEEDDADRMSAAQIESLWDSTFADIAAVSHVSDTPSLWMRREARAQKSNLTAVDKKPTGAAKYSFASFKAKGDLAPPVISRATLSLPSLTSPASGRAPEDVLKLLELSASSKSMTREDSLSRLTRGRDPLTTKHTHTVGDLHAKKVMEDFPHLCKRSDAILKKLSKLQRSSSASTAPKL